MTIECEAVAVELVVDRVEYSVAAVETPSLDVVDVPTGVLPHGVREGDRLWVCIAPRRPVVSGPRVAHGRAAGAECQQPTSETPCKKK